METIELNDLEPISITLSDNNPKSTNSLGEGIELLMNDKNSTDTSKTKIDLGELDKLEDELNDLSSINVNLDSNNKNVTTPLLIIIQAMMPLQNQLKQILLVDSQNLCLVLKTIPM